MHGSSVGQPAPRHRQAVESTTANAEELAVSGVEPHVATNNIFVDNFHRRVKDRNILLHALFETAHGVFAVLLEAGHVARRVGEQDHLFDARRVGEVARHIARRVGQAV